MTRWLIRSALVAAALGLVWRIVVVGMAEWHLAEWYVDEASAALTWYPRHPEALRRAAEQLTDRDPAHAEAMLHEALRANPADGQALMDLAQLWCMQDRADRAIELAGRLTPAEPEVHEQAADRWLERGDLQRAVDHWDLALQIEPELADRLFPVLLCLAGYSSGKAALHASARELPKWWPLFFVYAAENVAQVDTLRALFVLRRSTSEPLTDEERSAFVGRLQHEGLWAEAYLMWLNTLAPEHLEVAGNVYDGGFELGLFKQGFDWQVPQRGNVVVETGQTYGIEGHKALHVVFQGRPVQGPIIEQLLALAPGNYRFGGRGRPDRLEAAHGLEWTLSCADGDHEILAASERFLGADQWRDFAMDFTVPEAECAGQRLHLQAAGRYPQHLVATGEIWFDGMVIEARSEPSFADLAEQRERTKASRRKDRPPGLSTGD
jgi:tetratricopeptide (TPR) repeat protein